MPNVPGALLRLRGVSNCRPHAPAKPAYRLAFTVTTKSPAFLDANVAVKPTEGHLVLPRLKEEHERFAFPRLNVALPGFGYDERIARVGRSLRIAPLSMIASEAGRSTGVPTQDVAMSTTMRSRPLSSPRCFAWHRIAGVDRRTSGGAKIEIHGRNCKSQRLLVPRGFYVHGVPNGR